MAHAQQLRVLVLNQDPTVLQSLRESPLLAPYTFDALEDHFSLLGKLREGAYSGLIMPLALSGISGIQGIHSLDLVNLLRGDPCFAELIIGLIGGIESLRGAPSKLTGLGPTVYLKAPLDPSELALHLERLAIHPSSKKTAGEAIPPLRLGSIEMDLERYEFKLNNRPIQLTPIEFKLLKLFIERKGRIQTREHLLTTIWGYTTEVESRTIDTHVRRLREKLQEEASRIQTVRGVGYKLIEEN